MQSFEWVDAQSVDHAVALLGGDDVVAKAGGMDLLDLLKEGIVKPRRIVNLKSIPALRDVTYDDQHGLRLGALATLAEIASHPLISQHYVALNLAANHAATPQIRNAATIGGNLLQRPRCWYFRNELFHSSNDKSDRARAGENQYHAIFDNATTTMVHASTLATALAAYDATVHLAGPNGSTRTIQLEDFLLPPDMNRDRDAKINGAEVLTHITVPATNTRTRAAYFKQTERESYDWPLFDVGVVLQMDKDIVRESRIVLGWVAPTPHRASASEQLLSGKKLTAESGLEAAKIAVRNATPLTNNAYKVPMLEAVIARTIALLSSRHSQP